MSNPVSSEGSPPGLWTATFSPRPHRAARERASSLSSLLMRTLILLDQGSTLMTSLSLNCLLIGPISKYSHIRG